MPDFRYIGWVEYGNLTEALAEKVSSSGKTFDLVIGVARGGIPVAMVVSDRLGVKIDTITVKSYRDIAERGSVRILSTLTEDIKGERVLLVDDLVDQGDTMSGVKGFLSKKGAKVVKTAVLFKKPWSKTHPDYFLETTRKWIVFPFELSEVNHLRKARGETLESRARAADSG
ncbi:MAG: phosphoribosyltransferase family protein [Nitrososphaerales archaeon]|jgi:hypoxanthine phosphoribosyltransferase